MEYCKVKAKCEQPGKEKLERKCKQVQAEEPEAEPSSSKKPKKMLEESNMMVEVLREGLRAITDTLNKQGKFLQELMELEVDKIELILYSWTGGCQRTRRMKKKMKQRKEKK